MTAGAGDAPPAGAPAVIRESLQGKYAGFASRFTAFAADVAVSLGVFLLALAAISFAARVLTGTGRCGRPSPGIWRRSSRWCWAFCPWVRQQPPKCSPMSR
jgi:uncharacterized RDD family membrane protein YckC